MKFVSRPDKTRENDYAEDYFEYEETSQPRWIPSYHNVVRKEQKTRKEK